MLKYMNKILIFLAFAASFMLFACSEEKPEPSHAEICEKGPTKECLVGKWDILDTEPHLCGTMEGGRLEFKSNGEYYFSSGKTSAKDEEIEHIGHWELTNTGMKITCEIGVCRPEGTADVIVKIQNSKLNITTENNTFFMTNCDESSGQKFTEIFSWHGS